MKNIIFKFKYLVVALVILGTSSCDALLDDEVTDYGNTPVLVQFLEQSETANFIQTPENPVYTYEVPVTLIGGKNQPIDESVEVTVAVASESTAQEGVEFNLVDNTVTIPAGEMTANVPIEVLSENLDAFDPKTLVLEITSSSLTISEASTTNIVLQAACQLNMDSFIGTYTAVQSGILGEGTYDVEVTAGPEPNTLLITGIDSPGSETVIELSEDPTDPTIIYRSQEFDAVLYVHSTYGDAWATTIKPESSSYASCNNSMFLEFKLCVGAGCFGGSIVVDLTKQ